MKRIKTLKKVKQIATIGVVVLVVLFLMSLTGPISKNKAIALAETYCSQGLYCSGYHYDKGDNTCVVVFRNISTNEIAKGITVDYMTATKIYDKYGGIHE